MCNLNCKTISLTLYKRLFLETSESWTNQEMGMNVSVRNVLLICNSIGCHSSKSNNSGGIVGVAVAVDHG